MIRSRWSFLFASIFLLAVVGPAFSEDDTPGAFRSRILWRSGAVGTSLSPGSGGLPDPTGIFSFPTATVEAESPIFHLGGGLTGDGAASGGVIGGLLPTGRALFSGAAGIYRDRDGMVGRGDFAAARPVGRLIVAGLSGTVQVAGDDGTTDLGAGLNAGGAVRIGGRGVPEVTLHGALRNVGKSVRRDEEEVPFYPAFTPAFGIQFTPFAGGGRAVDLSASVSFDSFRRISVDAGGTVTLPGGISGTVGWWHRFGAGDAGVWPGVSIGVRIPIGGDPRYRVRGAIQPTMDGTAVIAGDLTLRLPNPDRVPPTGEVILQRPDEMIPWEEGTLLLGAAPENRELFFEILAEDNVEVREVAVWIENIRGRTVREWTLAPRGDRVPEGDIAERLTSPLGNPRFRGALVWNSDDAGSDGFYVLRSSVTDGAGNTRDLPPVEILVDTTPPQLVGIEHSRVGTEAGNTPEGMPERDGTNDIVLGENDLYRFEFLLRDADRVEAGVVDEAGRALFPLNPEMNSYADETGYFRGVIPWRGLSPDGVPLPEGAYRIRVVASDILGNTTALEGDTIVLRRRVPRFFLDLSDRYVAPNGDGYRDEIVIEPSLEPLLGLREWRIDVVDSERDQVTASWSGIDLPPEQVRAGVFAFPRDGSYRVEGRAEYDAGGIVEVSSPSIIADREPPTVEFALSPQRVRPEQGREVTLFFEEDGTVASSRVVVSSPSGGTESFVLATFEGIPDRYSWYLSGPTGELLQPGIYRVVVEAQDETGNTSVTEFRDVVLQERLGGVSAVPVVDLFSPNGDGILEDAVVALDGPMSSDGTFRIEVSDRTGTLRRTFGGALPLPEQITWDGSDDNGRPLEDGTYLLRAVVEVPGVSAVRSEQVSLTVDTTPPDGAIALAGPSVVSPDGDGIQDEVVLEIGYGDRFGGSVDTEAVAIRRGDDGAEERIPVTGPESDHGEEFIWRPVSRDGALLPDGTYTYALELTDAASNTRVLESEPFVIDTRPVSGFVRLDRGRINTAGEASSLTLTPVLTDPEGVVEWTVSIGPIDSDSVLFERTGGRGWSLDPIEWRPERSLPDGQYRARLVARYAHGPRVDRYSPVFAVDSSAPSATVTVEPLPFSPDGDGTDDILSVFLDVEDASPIGYWYLEVLDPRGSLFYDTGGEGSPPRRVRWDGRARNGDTVFSAETYTWRFETADILGNTAIREGNIPIDILLEPYEGGYRIQIPSITFPPNSAELILSGTDPAARQNRSVLSRLSEILRRYPDYEILVEGHAVNVSGTQREQDEELVPLSRSRAAAVRDALVDAGIPGARLSAEGQGGRYPIVPHDDLEMRWKNRRVDFILRKER